MSPGQARQSVATFRAGKSTCGECGGLIRQIRSNKNFCSDHCRYRAWDRLHPRPRAPLLVIAEQPPTPESRRDEGKAKAAANHAGDLELARRLALQFLSGRGVCIISDVRAYSKACGHDLPWHLNWPGSLFQHPWFEKTGVQRNAWHLQANARKVNEYRLTAEGREALRGMRG